MQKRQAPQHLQAKTREWWLSVVKEYDLEEHHLKLLTLAGEAWDRSQQAREALLEHGLTFTDRFNAPHARPEVAIERDSRIGFARLVREVGLDLFEPEESRPARIGGGK